MTDLPLSEFRRQARRVAEWNADFLERVESLPVRARSEPGTVLAALAPEAPEEGRGFDDLMREFDELIVPALTHWAHPSFFGYFPAGGSGPGALGEMLAAVLNTNAMVWQASPAGTELELAVTGWLGRLLGLPHEVGVINDTASSSTMYALAAARARVYPDAEERGLFGAPRGRVYASEEAHSSVEKAARAVGLGKPRPVRTRANLSMCPVALAEAMRKDAERGDRAVAVVATLGTTSTAAIDPIAGIARAARGFGAWVHADAAYGGVAAMVPAVRRRFAGWEDVDSVVVNPHKWLFTPIDCSVLFCRNPDDLRRAFSVRPEYLEGRRAAQGDLTDYGLALGRRFRSLKLWLTLSCFGRSGLVERLAGHMEWCRSLEGWIDAEEGWERVASSPLATTVFRRRGDDAGNFAILEYVNDSGRAFITHTRVGGRVALRVAIGNIRTERRHVEELWELLREAAREVG